MKPSPDDTRVPASLSYASVRRVCTPEQHLLVRLLFNLSFVDLGVSAFLAALQRAALDRDFEALIAVGKLLARLGPVSLVLLVVSVVMIAIPRYRCWKTYASIAFFLASVFLSERLVSL